MVPEVAKHLESKVKNLTRPQQLKVKNIVVENKGLREVIGGNGPIHICGTVQPLEKGEKN